MEFRISDARHTRVNDLTKQLTSWCISKKPSIRHHSVERSGDGDYATTSGADAGIVSPRLWPSVAGGESSIDIGVTFPLPSSRRVSIAPRACNTWYGGDPEDTVTHWALVTKAMRRMPKSTTWRSRPPCLLLADSGVPRFVD